MAKKKCILIIAEKPAAAKKIAEALADKTPKKQSYRRKVPYYELTRNGEYIIVAAAVGHLYNLVEKEKKGWTYPVFDIDWAESHKISKHSAFTKVYVDALKKIAKECDRFIVATDKDIEGELIGWNVLRFACNKKDAKRMEFSTLTKQDLINAYENAKPHVDMPLAIAGETRHILDHYWGINLSRALTLAIKHSTGMFKILSSGRVQGPALHMLYEKEKDIQAFISTPYWELELNGKLKEKDIQALHKKGKFLDKKEVTKIYKNTKDKPAIIEKISKREQKKAVPHPFDLTSLQLEAYSTIGTTPKVTLELAQVLYTEGYISYPRTSSQKLPATLGFKEILKKLQNQFPDEVKYLLSKKELKPNEGKKSDPAHPAIYPTGETPRGLETKEKKLYELITRRFFAVFGEDAIRETMTVEININKEIFLAKGTKTKKPGWFTLYGPFVKLSEEEFPEIKEKEEVKVKSINILNKETQPPKRYTEASIIKELEKRNLGTKATRSSIVHNLYNRGYIQEKSIQVTDLGMKTVETLKKYSPEILDQELTREFEKDMDLILEGKIDEETIIKNARKFLDKTLKKFKSNEDKIGKELGAAHVETREKESFLGKCHKCKEGNLQIRRGKFGPFAACSKYPDCKTTFSLPKTGKIKHAEKECEECKFPLILVIKAKRKPQIICINPDCPTKKVNEELLKEERHCPKCNSQLIIRKSTYGSFFACPKYPKCKHAEPIEKED